MQQRNVHIYFNKPVSQESLNSFKESLPYFDLEFFGVINQKDISGQLQSRGMLQLIRGPLLKALEESGLRDKIGNIVISAD